MHNPAAAPAVAVPQSFGASADLGSIGDRSFQVLFADPNLTALIDTALSRNPDIQIAQQRINVARANYGIRQGVGLDRRAGRGGIAHRRVRSGGPVTEC
jgi:multidrug efflux system outer membrane protein